MMTKQPENNALETQNNSINNLQAAKTNIVFIDTSVADYQSLISGITLGNEVVILDPTQDAVAQMTEYLAARQPKSVQSVHIVSHGSTGSLQLGSTNLNSSNINSYANQLQNWASALTDDADILLYGCDVASGEGKEFVQQLSQITGADVAASTNKTGNTALGGDWDLEFNQGIIEAPLAFQSQVLQAYNSVLANAGDVIINEFSQGSNGGKEWVEILVVTDNLNLQNHRLVDGNGTLDIVLSGSGFSSLKAGTLIVLYNGGDIDSTITPDLTYNPANGDYVLQISSLNNTGVFAVTRNTGWEDTTGAFNNTLDADVPQLRNASNTPIHTFPRTPTPTANSFSAYTATSAAGATVSSNWSANTVSTSATPGLANGANNTDWIQILRGAIPVLTIPSITINNPSPAANELFGFSLASGNTNLLIGAPLADTGKGEAYRLNASGVLQQTFANPSSGIGELFGLSVAINGTVYLIGAPKFDASVADVGRAYRFNSTGSLQQTFDNSVNNDDSEFGSAVAILSNGNYVIGAPEKGKATANDNAGEVRLFNSSGLLQNITNPNPGIIQDARFGFSVAAANNDILIGAPGFSTFTAPSTVNFGVGQAYRYNSTGTTILQTFTNPNPTALDLFGFSVKSNSAGTRFLIGAPGEDISATDAGAVYLYDNTTPTPTLLRTFVNPDTTNLGFGSSVAFLGNDILIGAPGAFSGTTFTSNPGRGAVYLYDGDGASPTYSLEKIFSNPGTGNDAFGAAITTIGSNKIIIGAPYYDAGTSTDAGIAYIFDLVTEYAISTNTPTVMEGNSSSQTVAFTITRSGNFNTESTVNYEFNPNNTATFGSDFRNIFVRSGEFASGTTLGEFIDAGLNGTLNFRVGEKTKAITVDVLGDRVFERDENITIKIKDAPLGDTITNDKATVVVKNDDLQPSIRISDTSVTEGNFGLITNGKFDVTLSNPSYQQVIVNYSADYGQTNSSDFFLFPIMNTLVFKPGETSKTISFGVRGDSTVESNEKFYVNLFGATNTTIADSQGIGTIINDDRSSSFSGFFF
ncbi:MAG: DUF4347 domain-containing protein [Goleter apudmare HA4340-LM2]|jgi:hypothetical protein|nr:DUF4347 domain-containing protein [Goleter apudmare HA4340-LM2]